MSKRYGGKSFKDSIVMKKAKLSLKERRKKKRKKSKIKLMKMRINIIIRIIKDNILIRYLLSKFTLKCINFISLLNSKFNKKKYYELLVVLSSSLASVLSSSLSL